MPRRRILLIQLSIPQPGMAFRQEARTLGLEFQPRPPYYVLKTPTLDLADLYQLMDEAQDLFITELDPLPEPVLARSSVDDARVRESQWHVDLDVPLADMPPFPAAHERPSAFTLWLSARDFRECEARAIDCVRHVLDPNPHSTLQVVISSDDLLSVTPDFLSRLLEAAYRETTYLDRFYSILPGPLKGSKRIVILLPEQFEREQPPEWLDSVSELATVVSMSPGEGEFLNTATALPAET